MDGRSVYLRTVIFREKEKLTMLKTDKIADMHIHCLSDIDKGISMIKEMNDYGIHNMNILALTYGDFPIDDNIRALYYKKIVTEAKISVFGGLYYSPYINHYGISFLEQAQKLLDMGCDGIKFIESKPDSRKYIGFGLNSKLYDDMFDMLEEKQIPIVCHINDPEEYWDEDMIREWPIGERLIELGWLYNNKTFLTYEEILNEMIERMDKNPNLNIIFAHFMFLSNKIEIAKELVAKYPNLKFDLTPGWEMYVGFLKNYDEWREFFEKYSNRIYYGTDTWAFPIKKEIHETVRYAIGGEEAEIDIPHATFARMKGFNLSKEAQENICYNNFIATIGEPKEVNTKLLITETEKMIDILKSNKSEHDAVSRLERMRDDLKKLNY